jgi:hypothetical protein
MQEPASSCTHLEQGKGQRSIAPRFGREAHEAHYKAVLYLMEVGAALGIQFSVDTDGNTITIATSGWSIE